MQTPTFVEVIGHLKAPVKGPSIAFAIIFAISFVLHVVQISKHKAWPLLWILPCACIIFIAGYICREYNAFHPKDEGTLAPDQGLLLNAVPIFTAGLYLLVFRLVFITNFSPRWRWVLWFILSIYMSAVVSITSQGAAGLFDATASLGTVRSALALLKASAVIQLSLIVAFIAILAVFHRRYSAAKTSDAAQIKKIRIATATLYVSAVLILARNIFRTVQIFSHANSPAWRTETFFWVFDAAPLAVVTLLLNVTCPAKWLLGEERNPNCSA
ncbi:MAG: hypothetical protein M1839_004470 [Geoglossum umbratile]|nr:MAG: hypothetical protein M1839_004470 [Geoglossum umbratile]